MEIKDIISRLPCQRVLVSVNADVPSCPGKGPVVSCYQCIQTVREEADTALSALQAENERLWAELEKVKAELNSAKSPEVLEAVDELMEFARTRMSTADWLYYVDVLGEWRGQKED